MRLGIILVLLFGLTVGMANAYELTRAEITLTDIWLEPEHPQAGDKVAIYASLYNGGTVDTKYFASVVTVGYFVDGELRKITELENVKPGLGNAIKITSGEFWDAEWGKHNMTVVVDYHNTLPDNIDESSNNNLKKTFLIEPYRKSKIMFDVSPQYVVPSQDLTITINGTLVELDSNKPLAKQKIRLAFPNDVDILTTDKDGEFKITKALTIPKGKTTLFASYDGSFPHLPTNSSNFVFNLKSAKENAAITTHLLDSTTNYNFVKLPATIVTYQDSYQKIYKKFTTNKNNLLDDLTAWLPVEANHSYLQEVYLGGRFFFSSDWKQIKPSQVHKNEFLIPDLAQVRFKISGIESEALSGIQVQNWIYSDFVNADGYTDWVNVLPTRTKNEPYVTSISLPDGRVFYSEPFFVDSGEKKVIEIDVKNQQIIIPKWIKSNAGWWAQGKITDSDFLQGLEYLIAKRVILVPSISATTNDQKIPPWIKTNAGWWSEGKISDSEFTKGLQYLIQNGIIAA